MPEGIRAVLKNRITRAPARGTAAAAAVVAASTAVTLGVTSWAAEGETRSVQPTVTRIADLPAGASVTRSGKPAGQVLSQIKQRQRRQAARREAARKARLARAHMAASRSADRAVSYRGDPRGIARAMMAETFGWGSGQFSCLSSLWERESGWNVRASNPSSGAYGIPQALPGSKMGAYGSDWQRNPVTQIRWGLSYIRGTYGTPCGAWSAFRSKGWY